MSQTSDLDDPTKTCIYLSKRSSADKPRTKRTKSTSSANKTLAEGYGIQREAYEVAWERCSGRVQAIFRELHTPVVSAVKQSINDAYSKDVLPGLPYIELPVIAVSAPGGGHSVISDVVATLERRKKREPSQGGTRQRRNKGKDRMVEDEDDTREEHHVLVTHLHPADCVNITSAMKAMIAGFVDRQDAEEEEELLLRLPYPVKRKAATSLASFDINLLKAWYRALSRQNAFETSVVQDIFYICSKNVVHLPLIFLLDSSAPSTMSFMHTAYPRAMMALLRVCVHTAPSGIDLASTVIEKTFFDQDFEPDIGLGFGVLDFLAEFTLRHTASLDAVLTILQLSYIKHFEDPLTTFVHGFDSDAALRETATRLRQSSSFQLIDNLLVRVWSECAPDDPAREMPKYLKDVDWDDMSLETLLLILNSARNEFRQQATRMRLGYQVIRTVQRYMRAQGYKTSTSITGHEESELSFMSRMVRGRAGRDVKHLALMLKKLPDHQLDSLLGELYALFYDIQSPKLRNDQADVRGFLVQARSDIAAQTSTSTNVPNTANKASVVAPSVAEWFLSYLEDRLVRTDQQQPLWELWNTGSTPFPSELINPAPRANVVNALLHPSDILKEHRSLFGTNDDGVVDAKDELLKETPALSELSDTSILFRRYMEAGRLINVYDLFESFAVALDTQREQRSIAASKHKGKHKAPQVDEEPTEDEDEKWTAEVHARFMRALHELDYMGFIKHTGRKADHVLRTVYDIPD
ncbi:hypothetical protein BC835DRAFT_1305590 [Cytidiella melzeri]|nr:hypothetical protein BC835DRAFT_1305590 [Cytidiella melzeri]